MHLMISLRSVRPGYWVLADQAIVSLSNFVTSMMVARALGVEVFGMYTLGVLAWLFAQLVHHSLITAPLMSLRPDGNRVENTDEQSDLTLLSFLLIVGLALGVAFVFRALHHLAPSWRLGEVWWIWSLVIFFGIHQEYIRKVAFARKQVRLAFVSDLIRFGGQVVAIFILLYLDRLTLRNIVLVLACTAAISLGLRLTWVVPVGRTINRSLVLKYWEFGRWLLAASFIRWTATNIFFVASGGLVGAAAIGALRASTQLVQPIHVLVLALDNRMPVLAAEQLSSGGGPAMHHYLMGVWRKAIWPVWSCALLVAVFSEPLISLVFGEGFRAYSGLVIWASLTAVLGFAAGPLRSGLRALKDTRSIFWADFVLLFVTLLILFPLIKVWSISGAAAGMTISTAAMTGYLAVKYRRHCSQFSISLPHS